jgi:NAD(P)-dependent dehydrogenase (short-subunit alcohol dehydrogenase family)
MATNAKKTYLITGGTTGIGLATAQLLAADGASVIITGRNPKTLAAAREVLPKAIVLQSDAADVKAAKELGLEVRRHVDRIDGVLLNAGVAKFATFDEVTVEHFDEIFNVNVRGLYFQLQSLLPVLKNPSTVVLTSSISASEAMAGTSVYSATKAAVTSFGKVLAVELAPRGIRVNTLSPGPIDTPIMQKVLGDADSVKQFQTEISGKTLIKRLGTSEEVARAARFLLTDDSSNIVGADLVIDGGMTLT